MFTNAVPLRERIAGLREPRALATIGAAGAATVGAGVAWYLVRRRGARV